MAFSGALERVKAYLNRLSDRFTSLAVWLSAGYASIYLDERGIKRVPAVRLSDGTLKFLCLMAILCHESPPKLVCIEEPEAGLHPDALRLIADALKEASARTQLVVTTHSTELVDAFTDQPESVLVCSRDASESTNIERLSAERLRLWLDDYSLGELWRRGEIGGNIF
jgi:predicted ATPase